LNTEEGAAVLALLQQDATRAYDNYLVMLNEDDAGAPIDANRAGLARELARMNLSLNFYTQWYWKVDLHNLMNFLRLRADPHAQYEIRVYAELMLDILKRWAPLTHEAFLEHRLGAVHLSAKATNVIKEALAGRRPAFETSGLSRREWDELITTFNITAQPGAE
jgi:thymidylate synthase (FAD)